MTIEQKNKALAWFRKLPEHLRGICLQCFSSFLFVYLILIKTKKYRLFDTLSSYFTNSKVSG
jgi:hypothetical protein